jgi:hypothetical protein
LAAFLEHSPNKQPVFPIAFLNLAIGKRENSFSIFNILFPFSFKLIAIGIKVSPLSMKFAINKLSSVLSPISELEGSEFVLLIIFKETNVKITV